MSEKLSIYVHIPFCVSKCRYCAFYSIPRDGFYTKRIVNAILAELAMYEIHRPVGTLYIGGGSPSSLPQSELLYLITKILAKTGQIEEITVEINPNQANSELLSGLKECGVSRISMGCQSFWDQELAFLGRAHTVEDIEIAYLSARQAGFDNVSLDLIFGIPGSTLQTWEHSLQRAIELNPEHISAYALTYEDGTPLTKDLDAGKITPVAEEDERQMYDRTRALLAGASYEQYEVSNFAKPGYRCQHNLQYWRNAPWIGLGPSAASWYVGQRWTNFDDLETYLDAIGQRKKPTKEIDRPSNIEIACETAILNLRMVEGIDIYTFKEQTGYDILTLFEEAIKYHQKAENLAIVNGHVRLTSEAMAVADSVVCDFASTD